MEMIKKAMKMPVMSHDLVLSRKWNDASKFNQPCMTTEIITKEKTNEILNKSNPI